MKNNIYEEAIETAEKLTEALMLDLLLLELEVSVFGKCDCDVE